MPRLARKDIETPYIHVMVQGINKEYIFNEEKYLIEYLKLIKENINPDKFELLAYCMMNNHAHFLFFVEDVKAFEKYMQKVNQKFAQDYNFYNQRCGVVFRNRYRVEPIYDILHLNSCIKYIHNNPVNAGMVKCCKDYLYSSYNEFITNTGVSQSSALKDIYGENCDYLELFGSAIDRVFTDTDSIVNETIMLGIKSFLCETRNSLVDVFCDWEVLVKLIHYLKNEFNVNYCESQKLFGFSKKTMKQIVESTLV
jgi:REP element-mobilizing transposase RayT